MVPKTSAARTILLTASLFAAVAWGDVCTEKPWSLRLPLRTPIWTTLPVDSKTPSDQTVADSTQVWVFLECKNEWMHLLSPQGASVWAKIPPAPVVAKPVLPRPESLSKGPVAKVSLGVATPGPTGIGAAKKTKSKSAEVAPPEAASVALMCDAGSVYPSSASEGLLGEDGGGTESSAIDAVLARGSVEKEPRGGRGDGAEGDRMSGVGGIGLGRGGRAARESAAELADKLLPPPPAPPVSASTPAPLLERGDSKPAAARLPKASGLQAGVSDDNRQFPAFLGFLATHANISGVQNTRVQERVRIHVTDSAANPLANVRLKLFEGSRLREELVTLSDGSALVFPRWLDSTGSLPVLRLEVSHPLGKTERTLVPDGLRSLEITLGGRRQVASPLVVDLLFVLDVTGSMQLQIDQLKNAIGILQMNLSSLPAKLRLRFGLVQYRDRGDEFVARAIPFTANAEAFSMALSRVEAGGGGDGPEDLQSALDTALHAMDWSPDGLRLGFVVTDAPAHLDYAQPFGYAQAAHLARVRGIKLHTVGCGTLPVEGEVLLRQIAQATGGKYVFLTQKGETGENAGGAPGAVSHHTGSNWVSEKLETALLRLSREEIIAQTAVPSVDSLDWFEAHSSTTQSRDSVVSSLFRQAFQELREFSALPLPDSIRLAVLPTSSADTGLRAKAAWLNQILAIEVSRSHHARVVERGNLGEVLREQALQLTGALDPATVSGAGKLLGADVLLLSGLHRRGGNLELILKLLRTSTGELLSATRASFDAALLP